MIARRFIELLSRWILGSVFIYASLHKIVDPCMFAKTVYQYDFFPGALINIIAICVPWIEMVFGLCLILGLAPRGAALGLTVTLIAFICLLSFNLIKGVEFNCGCFSGDNDWCHLFSKWIQTQSPGMTARIANKWGIVCDIVRDFLLLIPAILALRLLNQRLKQLRTR